MHHRLFVPVCLVDIIAVFLGFPVHGYQTFVVPSGYSAFISGRAAEVKHVPHMTGPEPGTLIQYFCHMFMIESLIFFAVILACGIGPMIGDNPFAAVFGNAHGNFRMLFVEIIKPGPVVLHFAAVPAEIVVIAFHIGNSMHRAVNGSHGYMGNGGQPCGIQFFAERVQLLVIFHQLF